MKTYHTTAIKTRSKAGYMRRFIWSPEHKKEIAYARYLIEQKLGRELGYWEHVHHRDGNTLNDDLDNLEVLTSTKHTILHHKKEPTTATFVCPRCSTVRHYSPKGRLPKGKKYCNSRCANLARRERSGG